MDFGVIGYGYWGPNIVRNLVSLEGAEVRAIADVSSCGTGPRREGLSRSESDSVRERSHLFAGHRRRGDYFARMDTLRTDKGRASERKTCICREAIHEHGRARRRTGQSCPTKKSHADGRPHVSVHGAVRRIAQLIDEGTLGNLYYYDSTRVNLGLFQHDINVLWDLAPHDLSIMDYLIKATPEAIVATGEGHLNGHEDVAFMTLYFPNKVIAHINVNWLSPVKVRTTLIGGEKRMIVWNDLEADEKVKVYDKGVKITSREGVYDLLVSYRSGDMWSPQLEQVEALRQELSYFVECISTGTGAIQQWLRGP